MASLVESVWAAEWSLKQVVGAKELLIRSDNPEQTLFDIFFSRVTNPNLRHLKDCQLANDTQALRVEISEFEEVTKMGGLFQSKLMENLETLFSNFDEYTNILNQILALLSPF